MSTYLQDLTVRLATGVSLLPAELRERHLNYLLLAQSSDGGFRGRMGEESDLYYTAFGLRGLSVLGGLYGEPAERAAGFLRSQLGSRQTIVDFFSLFYASSLLQISAGIDIFSESDPAWRRQVAEFLGQLKRDDGGYAKAPEGHAGSTYHTFLVMLVLQLIDQPVPDPQSIVRFLSSQQAEEGGWREIRASKRAGTNPTAAAFACLRMMDSIEEEVQEQTIDFLCEMQTDEGGLRANTRIPIADMLSSFTGGLTLQDINAFEEIDIDLFQQFVNSLQLSEGGFQAAVWDEAHDVEYTFYGLGCLALIENHRADRRQG